MTKDLVQSLKDLDSAIDALVFKADILRLAKQYGESDPLEFAVQSLRYINNEPK